MQSTTIVIFAFNRPEHLEITLQKLAFNKGYNLLPVHFFIDGPRGEKDKALVNQVVKQAEAFTHPEKFIHLKTENTGLRESVISGLNTVFSKYKQAIILEDDISTHPDFLNYHLTCLDAYRERQDVWSNSGFIIPEIGEKLFKQTDEKYFLAARASSWGWSTWADRWQKAVWDKEQIKKHLLAHLRPYHQTGGDKLRMLLRELNGQSSSWAILWDYNHFMHAAACIYPYSSFVANIGLDHSGTHSKPLKAYEVELTKHKAPGQLPLHLRRSQQVDKIFRGINLKYYRWPLDLISLFHLYILGGKKHIKK